MEEHNFTGSLSKELFILYLWWTSGTGNLQFMVVRKFVSIIIWSVVLCWHTAFAKSSFMHYDCDRKRLIYRCGFPQHAETCQKAFACWSPRRKSIKETIWMWNATKNKKQRNKELNILLGVCFVVYLLEKPNININTVLTG